MSSSQWQSVLQFWFGSRPLTPEGAKKKVGTWFMADPSFDEKIREKFGPLVKQALAGELDGWAAHPNGRLALILILDQFCRNLFRGTARAFAGDDRALSLTLEGLQWGDRLSYPMPRVLFFLMPLMHAEDPEVQDRSVEAYQALLEACQPEWRPMVENSLHEAMVHRELIHAFGRFPHRNAALKRASTSIELTYLKRSGRDYGQGTIKRKH